MTVRQVATDYPACQAVFLRLGEPGDRPTRFGHLEPLERFARRRGLDLEPLLAELARTAGVGVDRERSRAQYVHRPFVAWALAVTLSLGAGWGLLLLSRIGWRGRFSAVPAGHVVAHGAAQLWGFVALFVVGVALRQLPMVVGGSPARRWYSRLQLASLLAGVAGGFVWALVPDKAAWLGAASGASLVFAAILFLGFLVQQLRGALDHTWCRLIVAAGVWMVVWAAFTLLLRSRAGETGPGAYGESMRQRLIELALFGFALNAIYGFGRKLFSGIVGGGTPRAGAIEATFWLHNSGVAIRALARVDGLAAAGPLGAGLLAAAAVCYAIGMRGFVRARRTNPRPEAGHAALRRYIQLAFFWLLAGMAMLLVAELYWGSRGHSPPHAYLGTVRHALTVGFMTTLIMGVGQRLLPILGHTLLPWPRLVRPAFWLIATGNLLRVATELATPISGAAFTLMPLSAVLELLALVLFAANAVRTLWPAPDPLLRTGRVAPSTSVSLLLAEHPWLEDDLFAWGLAYVGRVRSVPGELTLGTLARGEGKDSEAIVARINERLRNAPPAREGTLPSSR